MILILKRDIMSPALPVGLSVFHRQSHVKSVADFPTMPVVPDILPALQKSP